MALVLAALYHWHHQQQQAEEEEKTASPEIVRRQSTNYHSNMQTSVDSDSLSTPFAVRDEWIAGVFGHNFLRSTSTPNGWMPGAVVEPVTVGAADKIGLQIQRLALGLYVRAIDSGSEASLLNIPIGSVLVRINGLPLLAEPSRPALERLWQYEGLFESDEEEKKSEAPPTASRMTLPVCLELLHKGQLRSYVFLAGRPSGISWGPCGDFALVKRVYAAAAEAGVKRGSILAAVDGAGDFWTLDHVGMAEALQLQTGTAVRLTCVFTPPAARASYYERQLEAGRPSASPRNVLSSPRPKWSAKTADGIEIKFHPLEYAIGSLCHAGGSGHTVYHLSAVEELAGKVAAGLLPAPTTPQRRSWTQDVRERRPLANNRVYAPCPVLGDDELLAAWDPLESLLYCLRLAAAGYDEERFTLLRQSTAEQTPMDAMRSLVTRPHTNTVVSSFLLQFIGIICAPMTGDDESTTAQDLTSILLKVSRRDEGFCQRLYFVLRSYISTLEKPRPHADDGSQRNLLALLNCLEFLRFAEKELAHRSPSMSRPVSPNSLAYQPLAAIKAAVTTPATPSLPLTVLSRRARSDLTIRSSESVGSTKMKGLFGRFRRSKSGSSSSLPKISLTRSQSDGIRSVASTRSLGAPRGRSRSRDAPPRSPTPTRSMTQSPAVMYENMSDFLGELDRICGTIERSLQKSFRQKMADWAMQPWSPSKDSALAEVTATMRDNLRLISDTKSNNMLLVNPVDSSELLSSVDCDECYILPSAHFPILLTFNVSERRSSDQLTGEERMYRTRVELASLKGTNLPSDRAFIVHGAVAGSIAESGHSELVRLGSDAHTWLNHGTLHFNTRSSWGAPQTLSLRLSSKKAGTADSNFLEETNEVGYGWVDLSTQFESSDNESTFSCFADIWPASGVASFDESGDMSEGGESSVRLKVRITTESIGFGDEACDGLARKRMLLYKHDDDLRQEAFAVQFIKICDEMLKASGLDMKLLTFQCIPVGTKRGFVEWVPGSVPLSEICRPFAGSILAEKDRNNSEMGPSMFTKAGLTKYESLRRLGGQQNDSLRRLSGSRSCFSDNPILDYLRSVAYDPTAPYLIRKEVMDTYVKSCAGYSVITYVLGVGDRHLDNLLLHQSGAFFHCDYSFILGSDPKTYLPVRVTEDMIHGMGGKDSDNYARFLSLAAASFLALRRPEAVRVLLSLVRLMEFSCVPDISENQSTAKAVEGMRDRLRLDLTDGEAIAYMESLMESSLGSKMWLAVDAMHSLGKKF